MSFDWSFSEFWVIWLDTYSVGSVRFVMRDNFLDFPTSSLTVTWTGSLRSLSHDRGTSVSSLVPKVRITPAVYHKKKLKHKWYTVICNYVRVIVCKKHFLKISKNMVGSWTNHIQLHVFLQCNEVMALSFVFDRGCKIAYYQQYVNQLNLTADLYNI